MVKYKLLFLSFIFLTGCVMENKKGNIDTFRRNSVSIDLPEILKKGKLTILAENSSTSFFYYKGRKMGFEYELLKLFANEIGVDLDVKIIKNLDSIIPHLNNGVADLIACNYTITRKRLKTIDFSIPFIKTHQVFVQRKPEGWKKMDKKEWKQKVIQSVNDLAGKKITVWKNSSYYQRLLHLQEEIGDTIYIDTVDGTIGGEELIEMVDLGMIDYTITEGLVAKVNQQFYKNIYTELPISFEQNIISVSHDDQHIFHVHQITLG